MTQDEARKRVILALCCALAFPSVAGFGIKDLLVGRIVEGIIVVTVACTAGLGLVLLRLGTGVALLGRMLTLCVLAVLTYELAIGGGGGTAFVWFFFGPPALLFTLGQREGSIFVAISLGIAVFFMFFWPDSRVFYEQTSVRFIITYTIVSILSYGLESSRQLHMNAVLREKRELEDALEHIQTLRNMLPLCSWCRKVRDDQGYWRQIEDYFARHSEIMFTHGICPDCKEKILDEEVQP